MSLWITTQIECDGCYVRSEPYVCMTSVATKERARLSKTGWGVSLAKMDQGIQRIDYCPACMKKRKKEEVGRWLVHWKEFSAMFPAACGVKNPMYWQGQDWATETTVTCPKCVRLLRARKAAR